jgi:CubicO group peptidase (beta-lactamase class C family)
LEQGGKVTHSLSRTLGIALCAMNAGIGSAQERPPSKPADSVVAALAGQPVERGECVGVAVGIDNGSAQSFYSYGSVEQGVARVPVPATEFEIGSVTKVFTTTLLALYTRNHVVKLDDPLQKYVPPGVTAPGFSGRQITLVDLATHTSGLPRVPPIHGDNYSSNEMFAFLGAYRLMRAPGTQYEYSNLGVALLAEALAKATGVPWETLVKRDITSKLGMFDTQLKLNAGQRSRLAIGYNGGGARAKENMPTWPAFNGAGALFSTMNDMRRFLAWNMGEVSSDLNDLLGELHKPRFALPRPGASIALGWHVLPIGKQGSPIVWKDGATLGYRSYIGFIMDTKSGVVILANSAKCPAARIGTQILAALSGQAPATIEGVESTE